MAGVPGPGPIGVDNPCITGIAQSWEVASGAPGLAMAMLSKGKGFGNWLRLLGRHHTRAHWTRVYDLGRGRGSTAPLPSSTSCRTKERRNRFRPRPRRPPRRLRLRGRTASPARTTWRARNATGRLRRPLRRRATSTGRPRSGHPGRPEPPESEVRGGLLRGQVVQLHARPRLDAGQPVPLGEGGGLARPEQDSGTGFR